MADDPKTGSEDRPKDGERFSVMEVFGIKLEVSNPRLAELLSMDARDALTTDVADLAKGGRSDAVISQAAPDSVVSGPTPRTVHDERARMEFRESADELGRRLGFKAHADGTWTSGSGVSIITRVMERETSLAAASHFVAEIAQHREVIAGSEATALFVVADQQTADVFKVAIRQRRLYHLMRTIAIDDLRDVVGFVDEKVLDHAQALVLLTPLENIDVGEIVSVIRSAHAHHD